MSETLSLGGGNLIAVAERSEAAQAGRVFVLSLLPYPDPWVRRRVRGAARRLVPSAAWAGEKADRGEIAQLALVRLLWLQREAHRAAQAGMFEAVALLTRSVIDTCIVGLY